MVRTLAPRILAITAVVAAVALVPTASAHAATPVAVPYTCTTPLLGAQQVSIEGELTATPDPATAGAPAVIDLQVTNLGLISPLTIASWSAVADIDVTGAETTQFQLIGEGGTILPNEPITGALTGTFTPTVAGVDELFGGGITITADVVFLGVVTVNCVPNEPRTAAASLTVV